MAEGFDFSTLQKCSEARCAQGQRLEKQCLRLDFQSAGLDFWSAGFVCRSAGFACCWHSAYTSDESDVYALCDAFNVRAEKLAAPDLQTIAQGASHRVFKSQKNQKNP